MIRILAEGVSEALPIQVFRVQLVQYVRFGTFPHFSLRFGWCSFWKRETESAPGSLLWRRLGISLLEYALRFFEYMLQGPINKPKANRFCVEWSLSGQNRFVNMGCRTLQAISRKPLVLPSSAPCWFLWRGLRVAYSEGNRTLCDASKSVGNFLRQYEGSEAPMPQNELLSPPRKG